jgi:hypothetical protein
MTTKMKHQGEHGTDQDDPGGRLRSATIGQHILHGLGQPGGLHAVQVRWLWGDHFRVNVLVGPDSTSVKVAHSYFLVADDDGRIVASTPTITRLY